MQVSYLYGEVIIIVNMEWLMNKSMLILTENKMKSILNIKIYQKKYFQHNSNFLTLNKIDISLKSVQAKITL